MITNLTYSHIIKAHIVGNNEPIQLLNATLTSSAEISTIRAIYIHVDMQIMMEMIALDDPQCELH